MKTHKFCPHCGSPLYKSKLHKTENKYDFECRNCQEDFWRFEVLGKHDMQQVKSLRQNQNK